MPTLKASVSGRLFLRFTEIEAKTIGMLHPEDKNMRPERGVGQGRKDYREETAEGVLEMVNELYALGCENKNNGAMALLRSMFHFTNRETKTTKVDVATVYGYWIKCEKVGGKRPSEEHRLEHVKRELFKLLVTDVVTEWNGRPTRSENADTAVRYLEQVRTIIPADSTMTMSEMTSDAVGRIVAELKARKTMRKGKLRAIGAKTVKHYLTAFTVFIEWALDKYGNTFPAADVRMRLEAAQKALQPSIDALREEKKKKPYTLDQLKQLVHTSRGEALAIFALQACTGMEIGSIMDLDGTPRLFKHQFLRNVNGGYTGWLHVLPYDDGAEDATGKNTARDDRDVFMYHEMKADRKPLDRDAFWARNIVEAYLDTLKDSDAFTTKTRKHPRDEFDRACELTGVPRYANRVTHAFRHAFINRFRGILSDKEIKQNVGHTPKSAMMHTHYGIDQRVKGEGERPSSRARNTNKFREIKKHPLELVKSA